MYDKDSTVASDSLGDWDSDLMSGDAPHGNNMYYQEHLFRIVGINNSLVRANQVCRINRSVMSSPKELQSS